MPGVCNSVCAGSGGSDTPTTSVLKLFVEGWQRICNRMHTDPGSLLRIGDWKPSAFEMFRKLLALLAQIVMLLFRVQDQSETGSVTGIGQKPTTTTAEVGSQEVGDPPTGSGTDEVQTEKVTVAGWDSLTNDLHVNILQRVEFRHLFRLKVLSKHWKKFIEGDVFRQAQAVVSEGAFTAINFYIKDNSWRCSGYDLHSKSWRSFPTVSYLPPPDAELFKEYSVCGHGGLMCAEVSKLPKNGELVVFNPVTGETRALPPLLHPRNPVLVHISVDSTKRSYKVTVAGSSAASDEHLSRKVEVFDSSTSKWKEVCDLPGPVFGLNEHQAGVFLNGKLFLISFLESGGRGVVAFDVENGTWLQDLSIPIPWSSYSNTLQLVESDGKLFLFSEQESTQSVVHCIDELEFPDPEAGVLACRWRNVVQFMKSGGRGLQVFPEDTCVGFGEAKLCIFNTWSTKLLLLPLSISAIMVKGACAEDQSMSGMGISSNAWGSPDFPKKAAGTLLVVLTMIGARVAWGIFRRRQAPGNRFDIMQGLEDSDIPTRGNPLFAILPEVKREF